MRIIYFNKKNWLILPIFFLIPLLVIYSQSLKFPVTSHTNPKLTGSDGILPQHLETKSENYNRNSDKYKFVFETSYEGKLGGYLLKEKAEMLQARHSGIKNFTGYLNEAGKQRYKVITALSRNFVAVMKLDETRYEYEMFETIGSFHFAKSGLQEKLEVLSETGFQLVEHSQLYPFCDWLDHNNPAMGENCEYTDRFLVEKEIGVGKTTEQIFINTFPGWGAKPSAELEQQIDKKLAEGFYPVNVLSKFEILLEKHKDKNDIATDKLDVRIVRSSWGRGDLDKKVNELAKQGYRLAMTHNGIAVMYRNKETAQIPVSYIWLRADKKSFEKNLTKLQEKGAIYRTRYPNEKGKKNSLIFEQKLKHNDERREYKVLEFEFISMENQEEKKVYVDLTPSSKENLRTMNQLVKEGFEVKDLFEGKNISLLLERRK